MSELRDQHKAFTHWYFGLRGINEANFSPEDLAWAAWKAALAQPEAEPPRDAYGNGRLIAAAPDLLAMLVDAHDIIDAIGQPETAEVAARMRATIAKARGDE